MKIAVCLAVFQFGCASVAMSGVYKTTHNGNTDIRQCGLPILVGYSTEISDEDVSKIQRSLVFWEQQAGQPLFFDFGKIKIGEYVGNMLVFEAGKKGHTGIEVADTMTLYDYMGCIRAAKITFKYSLNVFPDFKQERIILHEIGHALGFTDTKVRGNLMYYRMEDPIGPNALSDTEITALRKYYGQPYE